MSTPPQSMNSKMPIEAYRNPIPARNARSTSSGVATPSSTSRTASFIKRTCRRGPMKPGESPQRTGVLPRLSSKVSVRSTVSGAVRGPGTTSTSGMMWAGFSQCAIRNRSGRSTASHRCEGEMVDDPDATMVSASRAPASRSSSVRLRATDSGKASCTKAQPPSAASPIRPSIRSRMAADSTSVITRSSTMRPTSRVISRRASASVRSASAAGRPGFTSTRRTWQPPSANASAIWRPIRPAPRTPILITGSPRLQLRLARPLRRILAVDHHDVLPHAAVVVGEADGGVVYLAGTGLTAELREDLGRLGYAGGAERMPAADQTPARIDDHVAPVVASPGRGERTGLALLAKAQLLVGDHLGNREAVVHLGQVDVTGPNAGHAVG